MLYPRARVISVLLWRACCYGHLLVSECPPSDATLYRPRCLLCAVSVQFLLLPTCGVLCHGSHSRVGFSTMVSAHARGSLTRFQRHFRLGTYNQVNGIHITANNFAFSFRKTSHKHFESK